MAFLEQAFRPTIPGPFSIVFVHGLGGDARTTWMSAPDDSATFWPEWIGADANCEVWLFNYDADASHWRSRSMGIPRQGRDLVLSVQNCRKLSGRPLILVGHSTGGLVIKAALDISVNDPALHSAAFATSVRGIVLISTPLLGVDLNNLSEAHKVSRGQGAVPGEMHTHTDYLASLNRSFKRHVNAFDIRVRTFVEARPVEVGFAILFKRRMTVVPLRGEYIHASGEPPISVDADHFDICRPADRRSSLIHILLLEWIRVRANDRSVDAHQALALRQAGERAGESNGRPDQQNQTHNIDAFICHTGLDKSFVRKLDSRLTGDGLNCFVDERSVSCGQNWTQAIMVALARCRCMVLVLSVDSLNSDWAMEEVAAIFAMPPSRRPLIIPLLLDDCLMHPAYPPLVRPIKALAVGTVASFEQHYPEILASLKRVVSPAQTVPVITMIPQDRTVLPRPASRLPARSLMHLRSMESRFVGRVDEIWAVRDRFEAGERDGVRAVVLVTGTGGLGKTQLAIEYTHRFATSYPGGVFWIEADQPQHRMVAQLAKALDINLSGLSEPAERLWQTWQGLNRPEASLVVLDNFPEGLKLQSWLPPTGPIDVLVTTRSRGRTTYLNVDLRFLNDKDGLSLLNSGHRTHTEGAARLVRQVGGLPLAIELLRDYLEKEVDVTPKAVLEAFSNNGALEILEAFAREYRDELPSGHQKGVVGTFNLSWQLASDDARQVLSAMSELAPVGVPQRLLKRIFHITYDTSLRDMIRRSVAELRQLSLVDLDTSDEPFVHRLIRGFVRHGKFADPALRQAVVDGVCLEMARAEDENDISSVRELEAVLPHAHSILHGGGISADERFRLMSSLGHHLRATGRHTPALRHFSQALKTAEQIHETGHLRIASTRVALSSVIRDVGKLAKACEMLRDAVKSDLRLLPERHEAIALERSELADALLDQGDPSEAHEQLRLALMANEFNFQPGDPKLVKCQCRMAGVLRALARYDEAAALLDQALDAAQRRVPLNKDSIVDCKLQQAVILRDTGRIIAAEELLRELLKWTKKRYQIGHPRIARLRSELAVVLQDQGVQETDVHKKAARFEEAHMLLKQALASVEQAFPAGHPEIAESQVRLAHLLQCLQEPDQAFALLTKALNSLGQRFHSGHSQIAGVQVKLALVMTDLDKPDAARELLETALASEERNLPAGHPRLSRFKTDLAAIYRRVRDLTKACELLEEALVADLQRLGIDHPRVATRESNLALVLIERNELVRAKRLLDHSHRVMLQRFGADHFSTITVKRHLDNLDPEPTS